MQFSACRLRVSFGRRRDEIGVDLKKLGESFERPVERTNARQGFRRIVWESIGFDAREPQEIKHPKVASQYVGAQRRERRESAGAVVEIFHLEFVSRYLDDKMLPDDARFDAINLAQDAVQPNAVDELLRQPKEESAGAPIGKIEVQIEHAFDEPRRAPFEIAPFVGIDEACRRDPRPRR
ncbi:hypothetical protein [uncultured Rhodoblastus sp.]|uniref:hypothetical protein n=1 Tax=uncultured Rhodoblastus sp. TaxID=543037 RepID=UPI0025E43AE0|nr:hypothetical protein [uncultured Rhodoblastus sp.]